MIVVSLIDKSTLPKILDHIHSSTEDLIDLLEVIQELQVDDNEPDPEPEDLQPVPNQNPPNTSTPAK